MNKQIEDLVREAALLELPAEPLPPQRQERIVELTMKQINETNHAKRRTRPVRLALIAAAAAVLLCGTAFAAYSGWFSFAGVFGEKSAFVEQDIVSYGENTDVEMTQPSYTQEEQSMIEAGTMMVPDLGTLSEDSIGASTKDYRFTLEEMLTTPDTLLAVVRVDALTEEAKAGLNEANQHPVFLLAQNRTDGKDLELANGGMGWEVLSQEDGTMYLLLRNTGGQFQEGDTILFHHQTDDVNVDLFEVPVTHLMDEEVVVSLDTSVYAGKGYQWETLTITPISLVAKGSFTVSPDQTVPVITITLKDGTAFELANIQNGFAYTPYGTYGSLSFSGTAGHAELPEGQFLLNGWTFSQVVDLSEIDTVTIDGAVYQVHYDIG